MHPFRRVLLRVLADQHNYRRHCPFSTTTDSLEVAGFQFKEDRIGDFVYYRSIVRGPAMFLMNFSEATADVGPLENSACIASIFRLVVLLDIDGEDLMC